MHNTDNQSPENISRRKLLAGAAAVTAAVATTRTFAESEHEHEHHHHHSKPNTDLIEAALHCLKTGEACAGHCLDLVKSGDTSIAECLDTVSEMLPMCDTLAKLASYQSSHLKEFARVCIAVCKDCEKACKEHADEHVECNDCMKSCAACIKECEKITA